MKNTILICLLLVLAGLVPSAARDKRHLIKANYYYTHGAYFEAIPHLEKVAEESGGATVYARLGDCYSITNDLQKATKAYSRAVAVKGCKKEVLLRHAQLLMQLEKYEEAEKWLTEYKKAAKKDARADNLIEGCRTAAAISGQIPAGLTTLLPFNTNSTEFAPTRWRGLLVFASDAPTHVYKKRDPSSGRPFFNIYCVACDEKGNCSGDINPLVESEKFNIAYHSGPCTFSADGNKMYYTRTVYNDRRIRRGVRPRADSLVVLETMISYYDTVRKRFTKSARFEHNNREEAMAHPAVSPNGMVMALCSNMPKGQGRSDIYICKKTAGNTWSTPVNAGAVINTEGDELFPSWADDHTLCFSSDGHTGLGGQDIYSSTWDEKTSTFSPPVNMGIPINSSYDDMSLAIVAGQDNTWLSSNRPAATSGDNIFFYRSMEVYLRLKIIDAATQQPLTGAGISTASAHRKADAVSGMGGDYFVRLYPGDSYAIEVQADGYFSGKTKVLAMTPLPIDTLTATIMLTRRPMPKDTMAPILSSPTVVRNRNVMDSPGIRDFTAGETYEVGDFHYDYNKFELNPSNKGFLDSMLAQLNRHPSMRIEVQARTDCRGSVASNKVLSDKRALSVVNYLVQHGIPGSRLEYIGLGNTRPKAQCPDCKACTEKEHSLNRILEFKVLQL